MWPGTEVGKLLKIMDIELSLIGSTIPNEILYFSKFNVNLMGWNIISLEFTGNFA